MKSTAGTLIIRENFENVPLIIQPAFYFGDRIEQGFLFPLFS
jgi:hypothetical protein